MGNESTIKTCHRFTAEMTKECHKVLVKLINRQSEKDLTEGSKLAYMRDEIIHPLMEALDEVYCGKFEDIDVPLNVFIREAVVAYHSHKKAAPAAPVKTHAPNGAVPALG